MKSLFIAIFFLVMTPIFPEGKSWNEPPKTGQLFMIIANALDEKGCESYLIWRYKGPNPSFEEQFKEWHEVTPEGIFKLLEDGKDIFNLAASH